MRKRLIKSGACLVVVLLTSAVASTTVTAAETEMMAEMEVVTADADATTGTLGENDGFTYTYDANTKILTVTGEDSGLSLSGVAADAETIIMKDCKIIGSAKGLFADRNKVVKIEFENFDTSQITNMQHMFYTCYSLTSLDVSDFDTTQVTDMGGMFGHCKSLTSLDVTGFDTSQVTNMYQMFATCESLTSLDVSSFDTSHVTDMGQMFANCSGISELDVSNFDTSQVTYMRDMFKYCSSLTRLDISNFDTSKVTNMCQMFTQCSSLTSLDISNFDTSKVTDMGRMFQFCSALTTVDVSGFDTSLVTDMSSMFYQCKALTNLDVSGFNTSQVTNMTRMFSGCEGLNSLDVSGFDTSKVTNMNGMFDHCKSLTSLDVSGFDTSKVTDMGFMFTECGELVSLDVSGFDTSQVTNMSYMFDCRFTELDVSNFDTSKVTDMRGMFAGCWRVENLDVSGFDTSQVTDMSSMFFDCSEMSNLDISNFDMSQVTDVSEMLDYCVCMDTITAPKSLPEGLSIELPATFCDSANNRTEVLVSKFCNKTLTKVARNITISSTSEKMELIPGASMQLKLGIDGIYQDTNANINFIWSVDSDDVVTISRTGLVKGIGKGTAKITCVSKENSYEIATTEVYIRIPFTDIKLTDWQYPYVVYAYENNLMSGKGDGEFDMNGKLTRSEFVQVLYSYIGKPDTIFEPQFSDVAQKDWFASAVSWAKNNGVTAGNPDGTFGVYNNITREQLVVMLYQYAKNTGVALDEVTGDLTAYEDAENVSSWATKALTWAVQNNIISGKNRDDLNFLDPKGNTTRGECATMMMRYVELAKQ